MRGEANRCAYLSYIGRYIPLQRTAFKQRVPLVSQGARLATLTERLLSL